MKDDKPLLLSNAFNAVARATGHLSLMLETRKANRPLLQRMITSLRTAANQLEEFLK